MCFELFGVCAPIDRRGSCVANRSESSVLPSCYKTLTPATYTRKPSDVFHPRAWAVAIQPEWAYPRDCL